MKHGGNVWEGGRPEKWMDFSANLRPEGPPEWVVQVMRNALHETRYYPDRSMAAARKGLADYAGVPQNRILPTAGGAAAIDLMLSAGRGITYTKPVTFGEYAERAAVHGRQTKIWRESCGPGDTVVLCNPNNPTGEAMARGEVLALAEKVNAQGGELLVDEAFIHYCAENSVKRDVRGGLSTVGSLTKILCIPGVRLGYVCAAPEVIEALERRVLPWSLNTLAAAVAARLPEHLDEMRADAALNERRRAQLEKLLRSMGAEVWPSQSSFLMADFGRDMSPAVRRLKAQNILVRTCESFGMAGNFLRLAVKTEEENRFLAERLAEVLHEG